jgi:hypothetical protein
VKIALCRHSPRREGPAEPKIETVSENSAPWLAGGGQAALPPEQKILVSTIGRLLNKDKGEI